ncbi:Tn7-like element transposition protein TnsE [Pseudodesulfovibrio pelocollis]|uniref:Tn7-like element transposition protein TnsE n=1 Tax=Pseudodesulfovibrio pelocollis TaxID=3051432 RepID=UPI00255AAE64|nr:Tn7-like element transposition protein TnsE [Pseudodesulfovibrio sp. SB368]
MTKYFLDGIDDNVTVWEIGSLFRSLTGSKWNINVSFSPPQSKKYTSISNASLLARRRLLRATQTFKKPGHPLNFTLSGTSHWEVKTIGQCPIGDGYSKKQEFGQFCFVFTTPDGITVYLPQFELARILFFHGGYLSRTAIESDCLETDFAVEIDDKDNAVIRVMPCTSYSLSHLNDPTCRNYLSWILLNADVKGSYRSITKYQRLYGYDTYKYRKWKFQFDPPQLEQVDLYARGHYETNSKLFFLYEIDRIENIPNTPFRSVSMEHPEFENTIHGEGHGARPAGGGSDTPTIVHDDIVSNANIQPATLENERVTITFKHPFYVAKVTTKEKKRATSHSDHENSDSQPPISTEEGVADHGLPGGDWATLNDETNYDDIFENKFKCFLAMINVLIEAHGCVPVSEKVMPLPSEGRCTKHQLSTTGEPRSMAIIGLGVDHKTVYLLEVDTSDAEKALSTQLLVVENQEDWAKNLDRLQREMLRASLRWPRKLLEELCGKDHHIGVNHPQTPSDNKGILPPDSITGWAGRVYGWMQNL